jgi:asparagine synthase (glutamine-hydrolysing)
MGSKKKQLFCAKELFCARDKFGIKPFYYIYNNSEFIFCSEIKPLLKFQKTTAPNINAVNSYLTSEYYENKETTFYKNIFKLKPGHFLQYKNNKILQKSFWNFYDQYKKVHLPKNEVDLGNFIYELIDRAVKNSLISDVKIALAASGGLDSSILYHHIKKSENSTSKLISFKFDNKKYSEEKYVKMMNKNLKSDIEFFNITKSYFQNNLEKSILIHDEPFAGLPIIAYEKCFKSLKHHKVVLDGTGIDESHAGYTKYHLSNNKSFNKT